MAWMRRQDAGCFQCLEFARSANSEGENPHRCAGTEAGCIHSMSFCVAKTHKPKNGMDAIFGQRKG
jgi:hypothetical protein